MLLHYCLFPGVRPFSKKTLVCVHVRAVIAHLIAHRPVTRYTVSMPGGLHRPAGQPNPIVRELPLQRVSHRDIAVAFGLLARLAPHEVEALGITQDRDAAVRRLKRALTRERMRLADHAFPGHECLRVRDDVWLVPAHLELASDRWMGGSRYQQRWPVDFTIEVTVIQNPKKTGTPSWHRFEAMMWRAPCTIGEYILELDRRRLGTVHARGDVIWAWERQWIVVRRPDGERVTGWPPQSE